MKFVGWLWAGIATVIALAALIDGLWFAAEGFLLSAAIAAPIQRSRNFLRRYSVKGYRVGLAALAAALVALIVLGVTAKETPQGKARRLQREQAEAATAADEAKQQAQQDAQKGEQDRKDRTAEAARIAAEEKQKAVKEAEERKTGFHCLSSWDGSHPAIVESLKESLREPSSYEHIETRISPTDRNGNHALVMKYRARNGFGGMAIGTLVATVKDSDCSANIIANESS